MSELPRRIDLIAVSNGQVYVCKMGEAGFSAERVVFSGLIEDSASLFMSLADKPADFDYSLKPDDDPQPDHIITKE